MTDEPKRQGESWATGCLIAVLAFFGVIFFLGLWDPKQEFAPVHVTGSAQNHFLADPTFTLVVWHQHPGDLKNGRLTIRIQGKQVPKKDSELVHSFERWEPNEENGVTHRVSLPDYRPAEPLVVEILIEAANARDTPARFVWQNGGWKK